MSLVIVILFLLGSFGPGLSSAQSWLHIPIASFALASVGTLFSVISLLLHKKEQWFYPLALVNYILISITATSLIMLTGQVDSPFVALCLLILVFAGMFGGWVLVGYAVLANLFIAWHVFLNGPIAGPEEIIKLLLIMETPLIASYVIWHSEGKQMTTNQKAYNALAEQLSQVANKSEIVINSIADGVVAMDAKGAIQLINPAAQELLGWQKQDAIGLDYRSVINLIDAKGAAVGEELTPIHQVLISNKSMTDNNLGLTTKSGKTIRLSLQVSPVSAGKDQAASGVIMVFRDITQEKEQERQRGEFISTASHEMRTPVAAIEGYLALAMNPQTAVIDDKARAYLQKAYESTQHLGHLFQDLLTVSKAEDGRLAPKPTVIDVTKFTHEISDSLEQKAKDKNIGLVFTPGSKVDGGRKLQPAYYIFADPGQLREVLSNLIDNAIKYTKQGTVTIDIAGDASNISVGVTDTGIGIPPEDVSHLFQKFYRVDNSDTREIGGTGLGLFISRRLVEANNGHLTVESVYGKGSTFTVQFPRLTNEQAQTAINTAVPQEPSKL